MSNKNIPSNGVKEARTSCESILPGSLGMKGQVPGGRHQANTNKTPLNADNEDNVIVLGEEEWEDLQTWQIWKLQTLIGFHGNHQIILGTLILMTQVPLYLFSLLELI